MYLAELSLQASLWSWSIVKWVWETLTTTNSSCKFTVHIGALTSPNNPPPNLGYSLHFPNTIRGKNAAWNRVWRSWLRALHLCKHQPADVLLMLGHFDVSISRSLGHTPNLCCTSAILIISITCIYPLSSHCPSNGRCATLVCFFSLPTLLEWLSFGLGPALVHWIITVSYNSIYRIKWAFTSVADTATYYPREKPSTSFLIATWFCLWW